MVSGLDFCFLIGFSGLGLFGFGLDLTCFFKDLVSRSTFCRLGFKGSIRLVFQDLVFLFSMVFKGFFDTSTVQRCFGKKPYRNLFDKVAQTFDFQ